MRDFERGILTIKGLTPIAVSDVTEFMGALDECHRGLSAFEAVLDEWGGRRRRRIYRDFYEDSSLRFALRAWFNTVPDFGSAFWGEIDLELKSANFNSPGFWEFFGKLNPLEQIRLYLNDRHERKKDNEYRKRQEEEAADWEIEDKKTEVLRNKVQLAREMGASDEDIRQLFRSLVEPSLQRLLDVQDKGVIATADVERLPSPSDNPEKR